MQTGVQNGTQSISPSKSELKSGSVLPRNEALEAKVRSVNVGKINGEVVPDLKENIDIYNQTTQNKVDAHKELVNTAAKNSADIFFQLDPNSNAPSVEAFRNTSVYKNKVQELTDLEKSNQLIAFNTKDGKPLMGKPLGRIANFKRGIINAWNGDAKSDKILRMKTDDLVDYAMKPGKHENEYLPHVKDQSSISYKAGNFLPVLGKSSAAAGTTAVMVAAAPESMGASLEGLPAAVGMATFVISGAKQAKTNSLINTIRENKIKHPEWTNEQVVNDAENVSDLDAIQSVITNTALAHFGGEAFANGEKLLPTGEAPNFLNTVKNVIDSHPSNLKAAELGATTEALKDLTLKYGMNKDISEQDIIERSGAAGMDLFAIQTAFDVMGSAFKKSKAYIESKKLLSKANPETLQKLQEYNVQNGDMTPEEVQNINSEISNYKNAESKIISTGDTNKDAVIADLVQQKNELQKQKESVDNSQHEGIDNKIDDINQRIKVAQSLISII